MSKGFATGIMLSAIPLKGIVTGRGAVRLARTVRVREVRGSNPRAPTENSLSDEGVSFLSRHDLLS